MLSKLAVRMRSGSPGWAADDDGPIPAGYTYLAQFVAHDFIQNSAPLTPLEDLREPLQRDFRDLRLVLEAVYGGGPSATPDIYIPGPPSYRTQLWLGHVRAKEPPPQQIAALLTDQPRRDLARTKVPCPHVMNSIQLLTSSIPQNQDVLIADPRNDQHVILSQLTALFHELHNCVIDKISKLAETEQISVHDPQDFTSQTFYLQHQAARRFLTARKVVALVYRRIIEYDLLRRLLKNHVWEHYHKRKEECRNTELPRNALGNFLPGNPVPVEFSHAAFRIGHILARFSYKLNDELGFNPSLKQLIDRSSGSRPDLVPLACDWLVDWGYFFEQGDGKAVNRARRIRPYVGNSWLTRSTILGGRRADDGGLIFLDLQRGFEAGVGRVPDLIPRLHPDLREKSDLLSDAEFRQHRIVEWLRQGDVEFTAEELDSISADPPLYFFILFEAAMERTASGEGNARFNRSKENKGETLGTLGSIIVAETFFRGLGSTRSLIEDDPMVEPLAKEVFDGQIPETMPDLIRFMRSHGCLQPVQCR